MYAYRESAPLVSNDPQSGIAKTNQAVLVNTFIGYDEVDTRRASRTRWASVAPRVVLTGGPLCGGAEPA